MVFEESSPLLFSVVLQRGLLRVASLHAWMSWPEAAPVAPQGLCIWMNVPRASSRSWNAHFFFTRFYVLLPQTLCYFRRMRRHEFDHFSSKRVQRKKKKSKITVRAESWLHMFVENSLFLPKQRQKDLHLKNTVFVCSVVLEVLRANELGFLWRLFVLRTLYSEISHLLVCVTHYSRVSSRYYFESVQPHEILQLFYKLPLERANSRQNDSRLRVLWRHGSFSLSFTH